MNKLLNKIFPFVLLGVAVVALAFGIVLMAYLFLFGAIVGGVLFLISWIRQTLFQKKPVVPPRKKSGRIIDSDEWKKL